MEDHGLYKIYYDFGVICIDWNRFENIQRYVALFFISMLSMEFLLFFNAFLSTVTDLESYMIDLHTPYAI